MNIPFVEVKAKNKVDFVNKVLAVYNISMGEEAKKIQNYEKNVLVYYIIHGLTDETLDTICEDLDIKKGYLHTINSGLRKKGYLKSSTTNMKKFFLSKDLENIKKLFVDGKHKLYLVKFEK